MFLDNLLSWYEHTHTHTHKQTHVERMLYIWINLLINLPSVWRLCGTVVWGVGRISFMLWSQRSWVRVPSPSFKKIDYCLLIASKAIWTFKGEKQVQRLAYNWVLCNHPIVGLHIMKSTWCSTIQELKDLQRI